MDMQCVLDGVGFTAVGEINPEGKLSSTGKSHVLATTSGFKPVINKDGDEVEGISYNITIIRRGKR